MMPNFEKEKGKGQQPTGTKPYEEKYYRGFKKIIARKKRRKRKKKRTKQNKKMIKMMMTRDKIQTTAKKERVESYPLSASSKSYSGRSYSAPKPD